VPAPPNIRRFQREIVYTDQVALDTRHNDYWPQETDTPIEKEGDEAGTPIHQSAANQATYEPHL
jgi:hypothetical protein